MTTIGASPEFHTVPVAREERRRQATTSAGFGFASVIGAGVIVLAILASLGFAPRVLMSIAVIGVGAALLFDSAANGVRPPAMRAASATRSSAGLEFVGAAGAIVLGILALLNLVPVLLLEVATIAYGGALVVGAAGGVFASSSPLRDDLALPSVVATYQAARPVAGMAAVILGIMALTSVGKPFASLFLLISLLAAGCALFVGGLALSGVQARTTT